MAETERELKFVETVSIGTELLLGQIVDSNAAELGALFAECGIGHRYRQTVGDSLPRMVDALQLALSRSDIVITIGGLGPTADDLTRQAIAEALDDELILDVSVKKHLIDILEKRRVPIVESQFRQAMRPSCSEIIPNPNGTAPGLIARKNDKVVVALPGPPNEFCPMIRGALRDLLIEQGDGVIASHEFRIIGVSEASLDEQLADLMSAEDVTLAPYAKLGEIHLRATTRAANSNEAEAKMQKVIQTVRSRMGNTIYSESGQTLSEAIVAQLKSLGQTLGVAESCTGGLLGGTITSVTGSSEVFAGGFLTYATEQKHLMLGVQNEILSSPEMGAVSKECAISMADGVRSKLDVDWGVSITGVAGTEEYEENGVQKPNGLVFIGVAGPHGAKAHRNLFMGSRETVRGRATAQAFDSPAPSFAQD
ncbi:MAG: competence/damage-inducible protein A [Fimbriimonadaceae bacterium]